ncbi:MULTISPECIES: flagellar hook-length control protein FliK [Bacillales]|jgi:flagellar hook-length control protein FliK|uniref:Flagellar hook-length control protein FliK n=1 Tax=Brevibacillus aydinogluensis TaxID=927786 RepID=A0AA48M733_9BACL|nr:MULTISPECIES: flagellar hook-length control protein FliK [Bacillales]REK64209.1 MAG: flagellar hook-length control protein FliK [Brevibacillus sp.]MBR8659491.1 flagellar hook-length control protein FliK [Brevibacillus sp. NL20B1]MDT3415021.1 flagellar hook-length control protein FliK [Brevibacillus aydinogluensis]NNV01806.1 flagellar hook-length control protein FliK [Brevibacillus sp. MCWH]UFJ60830.1 flagellar hook-length control protein FliK [Anoxybacillus sediminis]
MNVANVKGAPAASAITVGVSAQPNPEGGDLFAAQIGSVLQNVQAGEPSQSLPGEAGAEDMALLADLLALIQQLFPTLHMQDPEEVAATFTQRGIPQATAEKLAEAIVSFARAEGGAKVIEWQQVDKQVEALLKQFGEELRAAAGKQESDTRKQPLVLIHGKGGIRSAEPSVVPIRHAEKELTMQSLRVTQALSSYQAEAAVQVRSSSTPVQQTLNVQASPLAESESVILPEHAVALPFHQVVNHGRIPQQTVTAHPVHAQQFAQQVTQLFVQQMKITQGNGVHEAKLILHPQSLGQVDVIITARDGVITAQFSAETAAGKELLDNQLPQLRAALTQQGLQVDRLEVNQHQASSFAFQQQREQARQQGDGRQRQEQQEDQVEFSLEGLLEDSDFAAVGRELGRAAFTGIR